MNKRKVGFIIGGLVAVALASVITVKAVDYYESQKIAEKRRIHKEFMDNSPFKESLTWGKKERNGIVPHFTASPTSPETQACSLSEGDYHRW